MFTAPAGHGIWDTEAEYVANFNAEMRGCGLKGDYVSAADIAERASRPTRTEIGGNAELPRGGGNGNNDVKINSGSADGVNSAEAHTVVKRERGATPGQLEWLVKMDGKKAERADVDIITAKAVAGEFVTFAEAKVALDYVFDKSVAYRTAKATTPAKTAERPTEGLYRLNGDIIKVQPNRDKTGLYAKVWRAYDTPEETRRGLKFGEFEFVSGLINRMSGAERLTRDEAAEFGHAHHFCMMCGIELTKQESIDRGIGPICAGKF